MYASLFSSVQRPVPSVSFSRVANSSLLPGFLSTMKKPHSWNSVAILDQPRTLLYARVRHDGWVRFQRAVARRGLFPQCQRFFALVPKPINILPEISSRPLAQVLFCRSISWCQNTDPYPPMKLCTGSVSNQSGDDSGGERRRRWRPCADCKEQWLLITITDGVKKHNPPPTIPPLRKIFYFIRANMRMCVSVFL